ncbi:SDR family NAD(P)-dependent oxidoreductase [Streptomyces sp. SID6673]|nr:SDR family NAD(P)-dependent oxidoreductase [Streptomyces sp. SID11726]NEB26975.1 SDR family NAD(P)-dependent oxidoreductase [Streptomyces sp. SID6673]
MAKNGWSPAQAPRMDGRTVVVTGSNTGIGLETTRHLARLGAHVLMACRNVEAAATARADILAGVPDARLDVVQLDLGDLASVRKAADEIGNSHPVVDVLINNAGVMAGRRELTADGFEMDFGTSFLGHFALTGLLLERLLSAESGRVVTVGSSAHRAGVLDFDDLTMDHSFSTSRAYARAKFSQLVFAVELQRRLSASGHTAPISVAAHPGATHSGVMRDSGRLLHWLFTTPSLHWLRRSFIMEGPEGALPSLRAATDPDVIGGQYFGPSGPGQFSGPPVLVVPSPRVLDGGLGNRLWDTAEELTGVTYAFSR